MNAAKGGDVGDWIVTYQPPSPRVAARIDRYWGGSLLAPFHGLPPPDQRLRLLKPSTIFQMYRRIFQQKGALDFRIGSKGEVPAPLGHICYDPDSGRDPASSPRLRGRHQRGG